MPKIPDAILMPLLAALPGGLVVGGIILMLRLRRARQAKTSPLVKK
jgi:hypothetical protein